MTPIIRNGSGRLPRASGLRRFARPAPEAAAPQADRCELCGETLPERHSHMVETQERVLACACTACALLFTRPGGRYRTVPDRVRHDPDAGLTAAEWAGLRIPVGIAFFMVNSVLGQVVASYPSPAGATECELDLAEWDRLAAAHPLLRAPEPDVEAILVIAEDDHSIESREFAGREGAGESRGSPVETFLIPVDACYALAGSLRLHWRGFDGGEQARRLLTEFLDDIRGRSRPLEEGAVGGATIRSGEIS
jgi:uncharacterized protein DUF5947